MRNELMNIHVILFTMNFYMYSCRNSVKGQSDVLSKGQESQKAKEENSDTKIDCKAPDLIKDLFLPQECLN